MWIWQRSDWPNFTHDADRFSAILTDYRRRAEKLAGDVTRLALGDQQEALIDLLVSEAIKTSAIEGEQLDRVSVRSSIKAHIGLAPKESASRDPRADGIAALMVSVREHFARPLDAALLGTWQTMAIPGLPSHALERGGYRTGDSPMLIVSGYIGKQRVHYEAPPSAKVPEEMARFLDWYNTTNPLVAGSRIPGPLRAGISHLWFESIHPFDDGNGRAGRAIADHAIAQDLGYPPLSSLSSYIEADKNAYYALLEQTQRGDLQIDDWLSWFVETVLEAQDMAREQVDYILEGLMAKLFSFASWNVEHFNGDPARVERVVGLLVEHDPDVFAIFEVKGRDVFPGLMSRMPTHSFTITESSSPIEILVGVRRTIPAFVTQRDELQSKVPTLRPGAFARPTPRRRGLPFPVPASEVLRRAQGLGAAR